MELDLQSKGGDPQKLIGAKEVRDEVLKIGELVLDEQKHEVYARGQEVSLTFKEFELLSYLMKTEDWCSLVIRP